MYLKGDLVLCLLHVVAGNSYISGRDPIRLMNPDQLCEWLRNHGTAGVERLLALRKCDTLRRNERSSNCPERPFGNPDTLQFGNMQKIRLICYLREILRSFAGLLLLVLSHLQARDLKCAVLVQREMDSVSQREPPHFASIL